MTAAHTPGPWYFNERSKQRQPIIASEATPNSVAVVYDHASDEQVQANAHLIAAAPELLASLEGLLAESMVDVSEQVDIRARQVQARAAIAKARGNA